MIATVNGQRLDESKRGAVQMAGVFTGARFGVVGCGFKLRRT
jgi:hypothetical protein